MTPQYISSSSEISVIRLKPGADLRISLQEFAAQNKFSAGVIVTCVGSLTQYNLRFANQKAPSTATGFFEIVSLVGTLSETSLHLHLCISDGHGSTLGGHLLENNLVYTTAEIAVARLHDIEFHRVHDEVSGYAELEIRRRSGQDTDGKID